MNQIKSNQIKSNQIKSNQIKLEKYLQESVKVKETKFTLVSMESEMHILLFYLVGQKCPVDCHLLTHNMTLLLP